MDRLHSFINACCPVCSGAFSIGYHSRSQKKALILPCNHSICEGCLTKELKIPGDSITCKLCNAKFIASSSYSATKPDLEFPVNYFLLGVSLEKSMKSDDKSIAFCRKSNKIQLSKAVEKCNECIERKADVQCIQCVAPYCNPCFNKIHEAARAFRNHIRTELNCAQADVNIKTTCEEHPQKSIQFWCDECSVVICSNCLVSSHRGHSAGLLDEKNKATYEDLIDAHVKVVNVAARLKAARKKGSVILNQSGTETLKAERQICEQFTKLHAALFIKQNRLLSQLYNPGQGTANSMKALLESMTGFIEDLDVLIQTSKLMIFDKEKYEATANFKEMVDRLNSYSNYPCNLICNDVPDKTEFRMDFEKIMEAVDKSCCLNEQVPEDRKYLLVKTEELPPDNDVTVVEVTRDSLFAESFGLLNLGNSSATSSLTNLSISSSSSNKACTSSPSITNQQNESRDVSTPQPSSSNVQQSPQRDVNRNPFFEDILPGCSLQAVVVHAISPNDFYVQRVHSQKKLLSLELKLSEVNFHHHKKLEHVKINTVYAVRYSDNKWYRAKVIGQDKDKFKVFYIDYGNTEVTTKDKFRLLPGHLARMSGLAIHCSLNGCSPPKGEYWKPEALARMLKMIDNQHVQLYVQRKLESTLYVDMYTLDAHLGFISVQESLIFLGLAVYLSDVGMKATLPVPNQKEISPPPVLNAADVLDCQVTAIVSLSEFYVQNLKEKEKYLSLFKAMQEYYVVSSEKLHVFTPRKDMIVAAMMMDDNHWYRAKIIDIPMPKTVTVQYVDNGKQDTLGWQRIKLLLNKFFTTHQLCYRFELVDIKPLHDDSTWSRSSSQVLSQIINDPTSSDFYTLKAVVHSQEPIGSYSVVLYKFTLDVAICINSLLVKKGVAVSTGVNSTIVQYSTSGSLDSSGMLTTFTQGSKLCTEKLGDDYCSDSASVNNMFDEHSSTSGSVNGGRSFTVPSDGDSTRGSSFSKTKGVHSVADALKLPIKIIRIVDPGEFYITLEGMVDQLKEMFDEMCRFYQQNSSTLKMTDLEVGANCVVEEKHNELNWHRGSIVSLYNDSAMVYLLDLGEVSSVPISNIYVLEVAFQDLSDGAKKCHLGGLKPPFDEGWPKTSVAEFVEFVDKNKNNIYMTGMGPSKEDSLPVDVFLMEETVTSALEATRVKWTSFNNTLRKKGLAVADGTFVWDVEASYETFQKPLVNIKEDSGILSKYHNLTVSSKDKETTSGSSKEGSLKNAPEGSNPFDLVSGSCGSRRGGYSGVNTKHGTSFHPICMSPNPDVVSIPPPAMPASWPPALPFKRLEFIANPTNLDNNCSLFLQDFQDTVTTLRKINEELENYCKYSLPMPYDFQWTVGETCICRYHLDKKWYRGVILEVSEDMQMEVLMVDYGSTEDKVNVEDLRKMPLMVDVPIQGQFCFVRKIKSASSPEKWPLPELDIIHAMVVEKHCLVKLAELPEGGYEIESLTLPNGSDFFEQLITGGLGIDASESLPVEPLDDVCIEEILTEEALKEENEFLNVEIESSSPIKETILNEPSFLTTEPLPTSSDQDNSVSFESAPFTPTGSDTQHGEGEYADELEEMETTDYIDSSEYIALEIPDHINKLSVEMSFMLGPTKLCFMINKIQDFIITESKNKFNLLMNTINKEAPDQAQIKNPICGMACCARFSTDGFWYRAQVEEVIDLNKVVVRYVDFGNTEELPTTELRTMKFDWMLVGTQIFPAVLHNVQLKSEAASVRAALERLLLNRIVSAEIKARTPELTIALYDEGTTSLAYQQLIDDKLLQLIDEK